MSKDKLDEQPIALTILKDGRPSPWTPIGMDTMEYVKFLRKNVCRKCGCYHNYCRCKKEVMTNNSIKGARSNTIHVHPGHFTDDSRERCMCCAMPEGKCLCIIDEHDKVIPMCPQCGERMDNCMCGEEE